MTEGCRNEQIVMRRRRSDEGLRVTVKSSISCYANSGILIEDSSESLVRKLLRAVT